MKAKNNSIISDTAKAFSVTKVEQRLLSVDNIANDSELPTIPRIHSIPGNRMPIIKSNVGKCAIVMVTSV